MNAELCLRNRQRRQRIDPKLLRQIGRHLLVELLAVGDFDLTIHLVNAKEMARLNATHLGHEGSTDVITLDYSETEPEPLLAGELFVCVDEAVEQAGRFRVTWQVELVRYIVHGVLHLQGHDDLRPAARRTMKREENRLVRKLAQDFTLSKLATKSRMHS